MKAKDGFTYLELLFTLSLFAIAVALVMPGMVWWRQSQELNLVSRQMVADVRLVQTMSMQDHQLGLTSLVIKTTAPCGYFTCRGNQMMPPKIQFPEHISYDSLPGEIKFDRTGRPVMGSLLTLVLVDTRTGQRQSIVIQAQSGRVRRE